RRQAIKAAGQAGVRPNVPTSPYDVDNAFLTVSLPPFYPKRLLVEPWDIQAVMNELTTRSRHGLEMPPLDMEPMPGGLFSLRVSSFRGSIKCYQLHGNGFIYFIQDVADYQTGHKNIHLTHIAFALYRHLVFARKFYARFGYSGLVVGQV